MVDTKLFIANLYLSAAASSFVGHGDWRTTSAIPENRMGASNQFVASPHSPARLQHIYNKKFFIHELNIFDFILLK